MIDLTKYFFIEVGGRGGRNITLMTRIVTLFLLLLLVLSTKTTEYTGRLWPYRSYRMAKKSRRPTSSTGIPAIPCNSGSCVTATSSAVGFRGITRDVFGPALVDREHKLKSQGEVDTARTASNFSKETEENRMRCHQRQQRSVFLTHRNRANTTTFFSPSFHPPSPPPPRPRTPPEQGGPH